MGHIPSSKSTIDGSQRLHLGPGERWFAARTLPYRENSAQFNLHRMGFRSFFPTVRRTVRHARKLRNVLAPLFPGYAFVILDLSRDRWRSVNGSIGVASLIMGAERPIPVPCGIVEALVIATEASGLVRLIVISRSAKRFASCRDHLLKPFVALWTRSGPSQIHGLGSLCAPRPIVRCASGLMPRLGGGSRNSPASRRAACADQVADDRFAT